MLLSYKWLKEYVPALDATPAEFAHAMTMSGSKVEKFEPLSKGLCNIVVGYVSEIKRHENSDKLWICRLEIGSNKTCQIVTAAQNVTKGCFVPVVLDGGSVVDTHSEESGKFLKIKKTKMRGEASDGMMCSYAELGLSKGRVPYASDDGILLLNEDSNASKLSRGLDVIEFFGLDDVVFEFEITNNRPDCLSVIGLAREAAAVFGLPLVLPEPKCEAALQRDSVTDGGIPVEIKNTALCSRYIAGAVSDVRIAPSPAWLSERLHASGVRSINNFVDITNYVMLEYGHPLHAFDRRFLEGGRIVVRDAAAGESITLLDGNTIELSPDMLVIADAKKPNAIAGVMGGEYSGIMPDTTDVVFESACFDGVSVRQSMKKIGRRTESGARFEKGLDPVNAMDAMKRALQLVTELACGQVQPQLSDAGGFDKSPKTLTADYDKINKFLGTDISTARQREILTSLGFVCDGDTVTVPRHRLDIGTNYDLAEEVARVFGYDNIPSTLPKLSGNNFKSQSALDRTARKKRALVNALIAQGCLETVSYGFSSVREHELTRVRSSGDSYRSLKNPFGEDSNIMRVSMLPSVLTTVARNLADKNDAGRLFEIGRVYIRDDRGGHREPDKLSVTHYGASENLKEDFFTIKGTVESVLRSVGVTEYEFVKIDEKTDNPYYNAFHPGRCAAVAVRGEHIGVFGEIHPAVAENFGISARVYTALLYIEPLLLAAEEKILYKPLPRFPAALRDISLICPDAVTSGEIETVIREKAKYIESVTFFDLYKDDRLGADKKSLSYKLTFRKADDNLTDADVDAQVARVLKFLSEKGVEIRT